MEKFTCTYDRDSYSIYKSLKDSEVIKLIKDGHFNKSIDCEYLVIDSDCRITGNDKNIIEYDKVDVQRVYNTESEEIEMLLEDIDWDQFIYGYIKVKSGVKLIWNLNDKVNPNSVKEMFNLGCDTFLRNSKERKMISKCNNFIRYENPKVKNSNKKYIYNLGPNIKLTLKKNKMIDF